MPTLREIDVKYRFKEIECDISGRKIYSSYDIAKLFDYLKYETKEQFIVVNLTLQNEINCYEVVATGSGNAVIARPSEVLRSAVILNLPNILLLHNHPSGNPMPSQADLDFTERIILAAFPLNITVIDHVIVGLNRHSSLLLEYPQVFNKNPKEINDAY